MRRIRLMTTLVTPEATHVAGDELMVDDAEAVRLLAARGLAEDLGEVDELRVAPTAGTAPGGTDGATGGEGASLAAPSMGEGQPEADPSGAVTAAAGPAKGEGQEPSVVGDEPPANPAEEAAVASSASQPARKKR